MASIRKAKRVFFIIQNVRGYVEIELLWNVSTLDIEILRDRLLLDVYDYDFIDNVQHENTIDSIYEEIERLETTTFNLEDYLAEILLVSRNREVHVRIRSEFFNKDYFVLFLTSRWTAREPEFERQWGFKIKENV